MPINHSGGDALTVTSNVDLNAASLNETVMLMCTNCGGPNTYQWEKDGTVLDGETSDTLTLVNINASFGGDYMSAMQLGISLLVLHCMWNHTLSLLWKNRLSE